MPSFKYTAVLVFSVTLLIRIVKQCNVTIEFSKTLENATLHCQYNDDICNSSSSNYAIQATTEGNSEFKYLSRTKCPLENNSIINTNKLKNTISVPLKDIKTNRQTHYVCEHFKQDTVAICEMLLVYLEETAANLSSSSGSNGTVHVTCPSTTYEQKWTIVAAVVPAIEGVIIVVLLIIICRKNKLIESLMKQSKTHIKLGDSGEMISNHSSFCIFNEDCQYAPASGMPNTAILAGMSTNTNADTEKAADERPTVNAIKASGNDAKNSKATVKIPAHPKHGAPVNPESTSEENNASSSAERGGTFIEEATPSAENSEQNVTPIMYADAPATEDTESLSSDASRLPTPEQQNCDAQKLNADQPCTRINITDSPLAESDPVSSPEIVQPTPVTTADDDTTSSDDDMQLEPSLGTVQSSSVTMAAEDNTSIGDNDVHHEDPVSVRQALLSAIKMTDYTEDNLDSPNESEKLLAK